MKQPTKKQAQKWANALRSGKYKQGTHRLQSGFGYCCLGVACEIFIPKRLQRLEKSSGLLLGGLPTIQDHAPEWLTDINEDLKERLTFKDEFGKEHEGISFSMANDSHGYTFDMIADVIELVYVHRALD